MLLCTASYLLYWLPPRCLRPVRSRKSSLRHPAQRKMRSLSGRLEVLLVGILRTSRASTWILPHLGELEMQSVRNGVVKQFAETISQKLGPKTTCEVVALVKMILESHVNEDGEPILDLKWRTGFIFENVANVGRQSQPTITRDALNAVIRNRSIKVRDRVFIALAASTGMRVGELLGLKIDGGEDDTSWVSAENVTRVRISIYRGQLQLPKT